MIIEKSSRIFAVNLRLFLKQEIGVTRKQYLPINKWATGDRPREKLLKHGATSLSDAELIALLIGSGYKEMSAVDVAKTILHDLDNDLNRLAKLSVNDLCRFKGIGTAKAVSIVAALELGRRKRNTPPDEKPMITSSAYAYEVLRHVLSDLNHEEFWVLYLNTSLRVITYKRIIKGGINAGSVDIRLVFKYALELTATSILLAHNHPSGNVLPSTADKAITRKIKKAGEFLNISLLDHIIVGENTYFSFADKGILDE